MWINPEIIDPKIHKAFVYLIENTTTGELYIGKKQTYQRRYNHTLKRYEITESDWQSYQSSSPIVKAWAPENIKKTIIHPCKTIGEATYKEAELLFKYDVLNPLSKYVNRNILGKFFKYYPENS
jgi:hypothetical protein